MEFLEKFSQIEIKADTRISERDRVFCEANQEAYEKAREALKKMAETADIAQQEQKRILEQTGREIYCPYLGPNYDCGADKFLSILDGTHSAFVSRIVGYFRDEYHVSLDTDEILSEFVRKIPESGWFPSYAIRANEKAVAEATAYNRELIIKYDQILDRIFAKMGGGSFRDVALQELRDACHTASWNDRTGQPLFEQKKAVIRYTGYGCSVDYSHERWKDKGEASRFSLTKNMKDIMTALSYFELGTQAYTMDSISQLCGYNVVGAKHTIPGEKVVAVQLYKTNRVDIRFSSEANARMFVEQFMGTVA